MVHEAQAAALHPSTEEQAMFCKFCGKEVNPNAMVCLGCGRQVEGSDSQKASKKFVTASYVCSAFASIVGFVLGITLSFKKRPLHGVKNMVLAVFMTGFWAGMLQAL